MRFQTLLLVVPASLLLAQASAPPERPASKMDQVKTAVGLSDEQVTQLLQLRREERQALGATFQAMREKRKALRDALQTGGADAATLGNLLLDIENLQKKAKESNGNYHTQALGLLNDAQKQKLKALGDAAKLRPAIGQAVGLNLLQGPEQGVGRFFRGQPMMGGPGPAAAPQNFRFRRAPRQ